MSADNEGKSPKKVYSYRKNQRQQINIPRNIENIFFETSEIKESIHIYRALAVILARIKGEELKTENQLQLFSQEFYMEDLDSKDSVVGFHFKKSDFLPPGYTNFKPVEEAFKFLRKYKMDEKQRFTRSDGVTINFYTNFISSFAFEDTERTGKLYLEMGSYWYFRLRYGLQGFNKYLMDMFFKTNRVRTIKFYSYLLKIDKTSILKVDTFNKKFGTNYASYSIIKREYLEPIRKEINKVSIITFGYHKTKEGHVAIEKIVRKNVKVRSLEEIQEEKTHKTLAKKKFLNKINYLKTKHSLDKNQVLKIKGAFSGYDFEDLIEITKRYKKRLTKDLVGERFLEEFIVCTSEYMKAKNSE